MWGVIEWLSNTDPDLLETTGGSIGASLGLMFWIFVWGIIVGPTAVIGILFKKRQAVVDPNFISEKMEPSIEPSEPEFDIKTCPQCAEEIKSKAKVCRFCRYEYEEIEAT